jgi:roadblock/LC7 domain-containing protein
MHKTYEEAMNRKAHRYALLKAAQKEPNINWTYTENDWTALKAGDTGEVMLVSVKVEVNKDTYLKYKKQYEKAQKMRDAKGGKTK